MKTLLSILLMVTFASPSLASCKRPKKFKNAEHPYAQAPDGCSGATDPKQVRDSWGPVSFKGTCNAHDRCYYTLGSDHRQCNNDFREGLLEDCYRDLRIKISLPFGKKRYLPPDPGRLALCAQVAESYTAVVKAAVYGGVFDAAQKLQEEYEAWYRRCGR